MTALLARNKTIIIAFILFSVLILIFFAKLSVPRDVVEVTVVQGDTLTSLAKQYAGEVPADRWIREVAALNDLDGTGIIAGEGLKVPLHPILQSDDVRLVLAEEGN
ncbi:hypothetical protein NCCP2716_03800 [Sporosarcina sp. NCCP-2716]|uniref:LysM peptidoglycan-binding domain-containing protein n=1 Tax=Sporosarcina sp. NCCP-2716 TaxID=2943679 RepID=UPI00203D498F|nr:LysM peptidoglycan-binding domain-containing protein [Sporosarcina sp. NCCP-2716]GKV67882.1 hypothetical protein NCCP2716_03800 [Sporosarcina sp. NCCP-2716]